MVKITYKPTEEIVVHQVLTYDDAKSFFEDVSRQGMSQQAPFLPFVNWADGVAFAFSGYPQTEDVVKDAMNGRVHYGSVLFAKTPFQPFFSVNFGQDDVRVRMRKVENNPDLVELARFLRDFKKDAPSSPRVESKSG